jgi:hypothetical protein
LWFRHPKLGVVALEVSEAADSAEEAFVPAGSAEEAFVPAGSAEADSAGADSAEEAFVPAGSAEEDSVGVAFVLAALRPGVRVLAALRAAAFVLGALKPAAFVLGALRPEAFVREVSAALPTADSREIALETASRMSLPTAASLTISWDCPRTGAFIGSVRRISKA